MPLIVTLEWLVISDVFDRDKPTSCMLYTVSPLAAYAWGSLALYSDQGTWQKAMTGSKQWSRHATESHDDMECTIWQYHEVCSLYSCCRYAMMFNSMFSLLERYGRSVFVLRSMDAKTDQLTQLFFDQVSCLHTCFAVSQNNELEVLNCWYVLNV